MRFSCEDGDKAQASPETKRGTTAPSQETFGRGGAENAVTSASVGFYDIFEPDIMSGILKESSLCVRATLSNRCLVKVAQ